MKILARLVMGPVFSHCTSNCNVCIFSI